MNNNDEIKLLDHGMLRLVSYMQPVPGTAPLDWDGDMEIARNARVSYDAADSVGNKSKDAGLIDYLYRHFHNTPFEAMAFTFEIRAPIFVIRQWHRHRTQSYNELSARYRELPETFYVPEPWHVGTQSTDNKQMRHVTTEEQFNELPIEEQLAAYRLIEMGIDSDKASFAVYHAQLAAGMPRELARCRLPFSTYTHMFATLNLNNLFKFAKERTHTHAQYEIRVYAHAMLELIKDIVPAAAAAYHKH